MTLGPPNNKAEIGLPGTDRSIDNQDVKIYSREEKNKLIKYFLPKRVQNVMDKGQGRIDPGKISAVDQQR